MCDMPFVNAIDSKGQTLANTKTIKNLVNIDRNQDGSVKVGMYNEDEGFHPINNPGWIKFELDDVKYISYIRILLWDNCGNGKKQPSNRMYQYRLMYSEDSITSESARWTVLYDTMRNGSNGWQEFYLEDGPAKIRSIKIHFCHNSRNSETQVVKVQAYRNPTRELAEEFGIYDLKDEEFAPSIHGIINNRIICGYHEEAGISKGIFNEVSSRLKKLKDILGNSDKDVLAFSTETEEKLGELNFIDNDISRFQASLLKPVEDAVKKQKVLDMKWRRINNMVTVLAIMTLVIDIIRFFR